MDSKVFTKTVHKITKVNKIALQKSLSMVLNFSEIVEETSKFLQRIEEIVRSKY